ncbi:MAG TPA: hypothetical protein P5528_01980 [Steroidobacteraceae bacterium]|nr:hypothetical protein [Steroidobacteraceae bacterium]HRX88189.1 hypothetical protein [Steroidobacteraceae bacterium]
MNATNKPSAAAGWLGWAIALLYGAHSVLTIRITRSEKTSLLREELRGYHYLIGVLLLVLIASRLLLWWRARPAVTIPGVSAGVQHLGRQFALATYLIMLVMPLIGLGQAWTEGLTVHLGPLLNVPSLVPADRAGWLFFGYFHSALGFGLLLLTMGATLVGGWSLLRSGRGLLAALPPGYGAQVFLSMAISVYALGSFQSPAPGIRALLIFLGLALVVWATGAVLHRRRHAGGSVAPLPTRPMSTGTRIAAALTTLALVGLGILGPYKMFHVTPWPIGETVAGPQGVTSHAAQAMAVEVAPESAFERQVRDETYKWCRFCHTTEQGGKHLVGPNLYAIFGQRAATVPNFTYSTALAQAGRDGLVWTDDTLDKFLASPSGFVPGTSMIISSGPVRTPEERAAVINILKRETMSERAAAQAP